MEVNMIDAQDIAKYYIWCGQQDEDLLTNLKLQKLLYYAQGFHLAIHNTPLFPESIEAWTHGPVVPDIYYIYKDFGSNVIELENDVDFSELNPEIKQVLDDVYQVYGQFSAFKLRDLTHEEPTWKNALPRQTISHQSLKEYFKTRLIDTDEQEQET